MSVKAGAGGQRSRGDVSRSVGVGGGGGLGKV